MVLSGVKESEVEAMDQTEKLIIDIIDQHRDEVIEFARDIYTHAELGYKEFRTSQKFVNKMKRIRTSHRNRICHHRCKSIPE